MLVRREDVAVHLEVQMVRRAVVNDLNLGIGQQLLVVAVRLGDRQLVRLALGEVLSALRDGRDLDEPEPPNRLDVRRANETSADDACFDFCHDEDACLIEFMNVKDARRKEVRIYHDGTTSTT